MAHEVEAIMNKMDSRPIEFEAFNLFPIDNSVITGIVSSITTYLVVLVQFQLTEEQLSDMKDQNTIKSFNA